MRNTVTFAVLIGMLSAPAMASTTRVHSLAAPTAVHSDSGATTSSSSTWITHTQANDWSIATSDVGVGIGSTQGLFVSVAPQIEYFVVDRISVGGTFRLTSALSSLYSTDLAFGPSATWHFWTQDKLSAYGGGSLIFSNLTNQLNMGVGTSLNVDAGVNYNFAPWFGIGPRANYTLITNQGATALTAAMNLYFYL